jgi:hypothetical protein
VQLEVCLFRFPTVTQYLNNLSFGAIVLDNWFSSSLTTYISYYGENMLQLLTHEILLSTNIDVLKMAGSKGGCGTVVA